MTAPVAQVSAVTKTFPGMKRPALNGVSAQIMPGRMTGLVGPDGAGKTTLLRLVVGLLAADSGGVAVDGVDVAVRPEAVHAVTGYMPQRFGLYEDLSVAENLGLYAELRRVDPRERGGRFSRLLKFTDLERFSSRLAGKLSGGMKQKLGLACALVGRPRLLLLDEPSVGVDPVSRRELWAMVGELLAEGMAVVWSTAYLDEADRCDTVILLSEGEKLFDGPPAGLLERVGGRTWRVHGIRQELRRRVLMDTLAAGDGKIADGVIQGRDIRIVTAPGRAGAAPEPPDGTVWNAEPAGPRFEDAFIDMLGGSVGRHPGIAGHMPEKPPEDRPVIEARSLTKRFGSFTAVEDNSFCIGRGEIFGLLGPNGAGKSTTFKMMCGLLQPTSGKAFVMGHDLRTATSLARSRIGYMAQKFSLYGNLSVGQNLRFFSGLYGLSGQVQKEMIDLMCGAFDLGSRMDTNAGALPPGFKQRLALACALMHEPDVLFLDEPTSGVDPITRREFWTHINGLVEKGVTVMVTTHFMDEAEYCDRIGLIYRGRNIATGTPDELKERAALAAGLKSPTLEDAFIALVRRSDGPAAAEAAS